MQQGPFSLDQLKEMKISPSVPVWTEGLKEWIKAREISELQQALFSSPPQYAPSYAEPGNQYFQTASEKTGFFLGKNWKPILAVLVLIITVIFIFKRQTSDGYSLAFETANQSAKTPEQLREELKQKEMMNPANYIIPTKKRRKNLIGETIFEGTLSNTASVANFKDVILKVTWLTKTNTSLGVSRYIVYEYIGAGKSAQYLIRTVGPSEYTNTQVAIESATPVE